MAEVANYQQRLETDARHSGYQGTIAAAVLFLGEKLDYLINTLYDINYHRQ